MADHLPELFRSAGLTEIRSVVQDEVVERKDAQFEERAGIWPEVIESLGGQLTANGFCTELQLADARRVYASWVKIGLRRQTLDMRAVVATAQ